MAVLCPLPTVSSPGALGLRGSLQPVQGAGAGGGGGAPLIVSDTLASLGELSARPSEGSEAAPGPRRRINETSNDTHLLQGGVACGDPRISEFPPPPSRFFPGKELIRRKSPPRRTREGDLRRKYQALAASYANAGSPSPASEARLAAPGPPMGLHSPVSGPPPLRDEREDTANQG